MQWKNTQEEVLERRFQIKECEDLTTEISFEDEIINENRSCIK